MAGGHTSDVGVVPLRSFDPSVTVNRGLCVCTCVCVYLVHVACASGAAFSGFPDVIYTPPLARSMEAILIGLLICP